MDSPMPALTWGYLKWIAGGTLGLLFAFGVMIQYQSSTGAETVKTGIIAPEGFEEKKTPRSAEEQFQAAYEASRSSDPNMRIRGISAMLTFNHSKAIPMLSGFLADPSPLVRAHAIGLIIGQDVKGSGVAIARLLYDPDAGVRAAAARGVAKFATEPNMAFALVTPLASQNPDYVLPAVTAWKSIFPYDRANAIRAAEAGLSSDNDAVLMPILDALNLLTPAELRNMRHILEQISSRAAGRPSALIAQNLLAKAGA